MRIAVLSLLLLTGCTPNCTRIKMPPEGCPKGYTLNDDINNGQAECIRDEPGCTEKGDKQ